MEERVAMAYSDAIVDADYSTFVVAIVYCMAKLVSLSLVWVSGYVAERDVNEAFTRLVYLERKSPPQLGRMVSTQVSVYLASMVALVLLFMLIMYLCSNTSSEQAIVAVWLVFDVCITVLIMVAVGEAITRSVSDQKYFNYRTEGLRAIRSVRQMLVGTMLIVCLFPFAASLTARTTNDTIARIITSEAMRNLRSNR
jgi:hypothetical protein